MGESTVEPAVETADGSAPAPAGEGSADRHGIGIDIGGSGVKAAVVDLALGELVSERLRIDTPRPATPEAVAEVVAELVTGLDGFVPGRSQCVGITVPAVVRSGIVRTAANIDDSWIGTDARTLFSQRLGVDCVVLNDADAAGLAEMRFGVGVGHQGVVLMVTLGTGIGSALFSEGVLVPNTELGHLEFEGGVAEDHAAASVREVEDLSWRDWGHRVGRYLQMLDELFSPELFIIGGGVSKKFAKYEGHLRDKMNGETAVVPAQSLNQAGILGAALSAATTTTAEVSATTAEVSGGQR